MIVLGIDPGTRITGYAIVQKIGNRLVALDYGCIRPPVKGTPAERYLAIFTSIEELVGRYPIEALSVETQFVCKNIASAMKLGMARGVAMVAAAKHGIPCFEYAPSQAKLAVVGSGRASKYQVQSMVQVLLNLVKLPEPEDAADALALAICHHHSRKASLLLKGK